MRFIGVTGGIGAGKSEILNFIKKHYACEIYLADEVAHQVKLPGTECYKELIRVLGKAVLTADGQIDKKVMADMIFADQNLLKTVNEIIHPAVKKYILEQFEAAEKNRKIELFFVEAALLIEGGYGELVDELWYIFVPEEIRRERLKKFRGYSDDKIDRIFTSQLSEEEYRKHCTFMIDNSGNVEDSYRQIQNKLEAYTWQD